MLYPSELQARGGINSTADSAGMPGRELLVDLGVGDIEDAAVKRAALHRPATASRRQRNELGLCRLVASKIEFQGELNLALIVLAVAGGRDFTEGKRRSVIERTWRGHHTVSAKSWGGEVRMIGEVKELSPEFQTGAFRRTEMLE